MAQSLWLRRFARTPVREVPFDEGRSLITARLDTALGLGLYRYGVADPDLDLVRSLLSPGDAFVDGGANVGLFTLVGAARVTASGQVWAFEPASPTRRTLEDNVRRNRMTWVTVLSCALADHTGTMPFTVLGGDRAGLSSFSPASAEGGTAEIVPVTTLDECLGIGERPRVRLVKLDLEGAEYRALRGATRLLAEERPDLLLEIEPDHLARQGDCAAHLVGLLADRGYSFFRAAWDRQGRVQLVPEAEPWLASQRPNVFATADLERLRRTGLPVCG